MNCHTNALRARADMNAKTQHQPLTRQWDNIHMLRHLLLAALLLAACGRDKENLPPEAAIVAPSAAQVSQVVGIGRVEPEMDLVDLSATTGGIITRILYQAGDTVTQGALLVQLDDELEQLAIRKFQRERGTQRAQIDVEQAGVQSAEARLAHAEQQLSTARELLKKGAETQQVVDDLANDVRTITADLARARALVKYAEGRLAEIEQDLRRSEAEAGKKKLRAPSDGQILDILVSPGAALSQFTPFAQFAPAGQKIIRAEVDELFAQRLRTGQRVEIRYTGTTDVIASGEITLLSPYLKRKSLFSEKAGDQEDRRVREIRVALRDEPDLLINAKVECIITL